MRGSRALWTTPTPTMDQTQPGQKGKEHETIEDRRYYLKRYLLTEILGLCLLSGGLAMSTRTVPYKARI
jgi:hypothetical protein